MKKELFLITGLLCLYVSAYCYSPPYLLQPINQAKSLSPNQTFTWVTTSDSKNYTLKINECVYEEGNYSNSINLGAYELLREKFVSNAKKSSGLTWAEGFQSPLVICADEFQQLDGYGISLTRVKFNRLFGFENSVRNYKGLTHLYNDHFCLTDEATGKLIYLDYEPRKYVNITYPLVPKYDLNINNGNGNEGIEGIAYNQFNNSIYVAKEKSPMQLFEFKAAESPNFDTAPANLSQPFNLEDAARNWGISNVSGLFHLSKASELNGTKASNNLLVLSSQSNVLIECDLNGNEISRLDLSENGANGTLSKAINNAEGIAYGAGVIYVLTSANPEKEIPSYFYSFSNKNYKVATTSIGKQVYTKTNIQGGAHTVSNLNIESSKTYCWNIESIDIDGQKYPSNYFSFGRQEAEVILLKKPLLNATYNLGQIINIEWEQNFDFNVNVYLYKSNAINKTIKFNFDGRKLQFKVPKDIYSGDYNIRITSSNDETIYKDVLIKINGIEQPTGPLIQISSPINGQSYFAGSTLPIKWLYDSNEKVIITLKSDNVEIYEIEKDYLNTGNYNFKVPTIPKSNNYYIEIRSTINNEIVAESAKFTITSQQGISNVKISNGYLGNTTKYLPGDNIVLTWDDQISGDVIIQLYNNRRWVSGFTGVTKSDGYEELILKPNLPLDYRIDYRIRVISKDNNKIFAYSEPFKIASHTAFNFIVPTNTTYNSKNMLVVKWDQLLNNVNGLDRVKLTLRQQNKTIKQITGSTNNDGLFYWFPNVPDGDNYRIFIQSTTNEGLVSLSSNFSFIGGQAKITKQPAFVVAPNPASDFLNISFKNAVDGDVNLKLYNAVGVCLKDFIVEEQNFRLDVSTLTLGYYFLQMENDEYSINKKILIR